MNTERQGLIHATWTKALQSGHFSWPAEEVTVPIWPELTERAADGPANPQIAVPIGITHLHFRLEHDRQVAGGRPTYRVVCEGEVVDSGYWEDLPRRDSAA
ncbi:MAG: hypothetical protein GY788_09580 [bacterium]|nr:hypothetical protein [bacterium]